MQLTLASGTLASDRLPTVPTTKGGTGLTTIGTANQASGTVPIARIDLNLLTTSTADADGDFFAVVMEEQQALEYQTVDSMANLNADNLTSGTVPDARFPATLPALNGSALTALMQLNLLLELFQMQDSQLLCQHLTEAH
jgi:hypothetical protein